MGFAVALGLALATVVGGCGAAEEKAAAPPAPAPKAQAVVPAAPDAAAQAAEIFATRCVTCHGSQGAGDGPASAGLTPPPRNFRDPAWQSSVTDDYIAKIVSFGGGAVGKSPAMPGNPDLIAQREVLAALVARIRALPAQ